MNPIEKHKRLAQLQETVQQCNGCHFNMPQATQLVFGEGNPNAQLMLIGEAPGRDEDLQGRPFVGRSGRLLSKVLESLGVDRGDVYITNIVKIRPPENRKPFPSEINASRPLLYKQIEIIKPLVITTLGASALEGLIDEPVQITKCRGKAIKWRGLTIIPTYHPAYILRNGSRLDQFYNDIQKAKEIISGG